MSAMSAAHTFKGQCLCGAVKFSITAPTLWCAHCHCSLCRRAHGAGFVTWVGSAEERFALDDSEGQLCWYGSSEDSRRGFCSRCGSTLFFQSERWPGEMHVARSNIQGEIDRDPQAHVYCQSQAEWITIGDELPHKQ